MKIKYVHSANPGVEKIHDTEKSLKGCIGFIHAMGSERTQGEWDRHILSRFEHDKAKGLVLDYSIIEEGRRSDGIPAQDCR